MASGGYPGTFAKGFPITGIDKAEGLGIKVLHSGTVLDGNVLKTDSGRVLSVISLGKDLDSAVIKGYKGTEKIDFRFRHFRTDIGGRIRDKII
jgi:phosphoribosylamine-glycine ligase